jgi:hypothetical protein
MQKTNHKPQKFHTVEEYRAAIFPVASSRDRYINTGVRELGEAIVSTALESNCDLLHNRESPPSERAD